MFTSGELRDLAKSIRGEVSEVATVIQGVVSRVDPAGTVWVLIGDNADPTPCAMDMACRPGDVVTVRIANHKATVIGNETAPATDDRAANVAHGVASVAQETATVAQDTAEVAQNTAIQAKKVASNAATKADVAEIAAQEAARVASAVNQHFWDDERGAHVTEEKKDDYLVEPSGFQQLMTSIGTLLTRAVNGIEYLLRSDTRSGMAIYDGTCTADDANLAQHMVASFTTDGAQIGKEGDAHVIIDDDEMTRKVPYVDGQTSGLFDQFKINKDGIEFRPHPRLDTEPSFKLYTPWESWVAQETVTLPSNRQIQFSSFRYQYNSFSRLFYDGQEVPSGYTVYPTYIYVWKTEIPVGASLVVEYNTNSPRTELRLHKNDTSQGRYDDALRVDLNGTKTASITWDGALSCADGSPYCKDGTDVKCGGATVGSADNLSYVASTDTFRAPELATGYTGVTGVSVHSSSMVYRSGHFVFVSLIFQVSASAPSAAGSIWVTGLPRANNMHYLIGADRQGNAVRMNLLGSGNLTIDMPKPSNDWYTINGFYLAAD